MQTTHVESVIAKVMVRCYIGQCYRALTASEVKREIKAMWQFVPDESVSVQDF